MLASSAGEIAEFGPFFVVAVHDSVNEPWLSMQELVDGPKVLAARVDRVRSALARGGPVELRVAASVTHLGLVARIIAAAIGASALGHPSNWSLADLAWQDQLGGPYPLSVALQPAGGDAAVDTITDAFDRFGVGRKVLWGNVGSAANSAAKMIAQARPELSEAARAGADAWLADARVDGGGLRAGPTFRRKSCCLIYQVAGDRSACCGDCVLTAPAADRTLDARWTTATGQPSGRGTRSTSGGS